MSVDMDTTVWLVATGAELDQVARSGWRAWPVQEGSAVEVYRRRSEAVAEARERLVPAHGVGHLLAVDLEPRVLDGWGADSAMVNIVDLNAGLTGAVREEADYRAAVDDQEFSVGPALPAAWRAYLQSESWFRRGWLASGAYLWLYTPAEGADILDEWGTEDHPGAAIIGGDGSREHLLLDLRQASSPVLMADITSEGWSSAFEQAPDIASFVAGVEAGTFVFSFGT